MSDHKVISDDEEFSTVLDSAGAKLVVVNFNTLRPGQTINETFIQLSNKFPLAVFVTGFSPGVSTFFHGSTQLSNQIFDASTAHDFYVSTAMRNLEKVHSVRGDLVLATLFYEGALENNSVGVGFKVKLEKLNGEINPYNDWSRLDKTYMKQELWKLIKDLNAEPQDTIWLQGKLLNDEDPDDETSGGHGDAKQPKLDETVNGTGESDMQPSLNSTIQSIPSDGRLGESFMLFPVNDSRLVPALLKKTGTFVKENATFGDFLDLEC